MSWSQHGEDVWLERFLIENKINLFPVIIDIGAGDGIDASNSKLFIDKYNFQGLLIDANKEKIKEAKKSYRNNNMVSCFAFMISDKSYKAKLRRIKGKDWKWSKVTPCRDSGEYTVTLTEFFDDNGIKEVGILSLDIEGLDTCVIKEMFKNSNVRPECIIIEGNSENERRRQREMISEKGYDLINTLSVNQIFMQKNLLKKE